MTSPMNYVDQPDCPEGMTLAAWRASKHEAARRPRGVLAKLKARRSRRGQVEPVAIAPSERRAA